MAGNKPLTVTLIAKRTCEIVASQAGNETYAAATDVIVDFKVARPGLKPLRYVATPRERGVVL